MTEESNLLDSLKTRIYGNQEIGIIITRQEVCKRKCNFRKLNKIQFLLNPLQVSSYQFHFIHLDQEKDSGPIFEEGGDRNGKPGHTHRERNSQVRFLKSSVRLFLTIE